MVDLKSRNLDLMEKMGHIFIDGSSGVKVSVLVARLTGSPTAVVESESGKLALHSFFSPEAEAAKWAESRGGCDGISKVLLYGFGFGYHIQALLNESPDLKIYVVDASPEIFSAAAETRDLSQILSSPNVKIIVAPPLLMMDILKEVAAAMAESRAESALLAHRPSLDILPPETEWLKHAFEMALTISSGNARMSDHEYIESNIKSNERLFAASRSVREIHGMFDGWPIMVADSGPSLDYSARVMSRAAALPVVIAVDSALKPLAAEGIRPDFVVSGSPRPEAAAMFEGVDIKRTRLIFFRQTSPDVIAMFSQAGRYAAEILELEKGGIYDPREGELFYCGTVFSAAVDFAVRCGGRPVALVGADFSHTRSRTIATGAGDPLEADSSKLKPYFVKGVDGTPVRSSKTLKLLLEDFESYCETLSHKTDFINCSAHGADIRGVPHFSLAEALIKFTS